MSDLYLFRCIENYKKMRKAALLGIVSAGVGAGVYIAYKKYMQLQEDKEYYKKYTEENPLEDYQARMDFYEAEFKRQDEKEEQELKEAIEKFNSRRLNRENCPVCKNKRNFKNRRNFKNKSQIDKNKYPKEEYEEYIYLEK